MQEKAKVRSDFRETRWMRVQGFKGASASWERRHGLGRIGVIVISGPSVGVQGLSQPAVWN